MSGGPYAAFLSYSQADEALATWLHRSLEGFRIPEALVGYEGPNGPIGKRLGEVYLHNVENGLGGEARAALERSEALVVLRAAEAARLDARDEVRHFTGLGRTRIVSAVTGEAPRGAQPIVWRKLVDEGGAPAARDTGAVVDFRADTKAQRDGAKLKLIATLLDVDVEELEEPPAPPLRMPALPKLPPAPKLPSMPALPSLPKISPHTAGVAAGAMAVLLVVGGAAWFVSNLPPGAPPAQTASVEAETQVALAEPEPIPTAPPRSTPAPPPPIAEPSLIPTPAPAAAVEPPPARSAPSQTQPPTQVATPRPQPTPATRMPSQVAASPPTPAPAQVAAAPPREPPPPAQQSAPPVQTADARPTVETVSLASLSAQLRELGAAHSVAIRCLGRSSQESRLRARHLIASSPEPNRGELIRAFNEGYTAAETRAGECPGGVQPTSG